MTHKLNSIKKISVILVIAIMFFMQNLITSFGLLNFTNKEVFADSLISQINISNANFTSNGSGSLVDPSSYSKLGSQNNIVAGVISTKAEVFAENSEDYKLNFNPSHTNASEDVNVLMINSQNTDSSFGYKTSDFTLAKNGYYYVSCYVYTQFDEISSLASLYLSNSNLDEMEESKIECISTKGIWKEYRFYVKTNSNDQTVGLCLYIGTKDNFKSAGAVFFDNLSAYSLSEEEYYNQINLANIEHKEISLKDKNVTANNGLTNGDFETSLSEFTKEDSNPVTNENLSKIVGIGSYFDSEDSKITENPTSANRLNNNYAFMINNSTPQETTYKSKDLLIEQHKNYRLTVDVKTSSFTSGGAKIALTQQNPFSSEEYETAKAEFTTINTASQTNSITNNWITYSFLIKGNVFTNSKANLSLGLDASANGYVLFDNIKLFEITTSEYDNESSQTNAKAVDFSNLKESPKISNGAFNDVLVNDVDKTYPYEPKDITVVNNNEDNFNGIINVHSTNFNAQNYPFTNPVSKNNSDANLSYNNVFVLANTKLDYQTAKTKTFNLTASSLETTNYYKVSLYLNTQSIIDYGVNISLKTNTETIANLRNINTNGNWQEIIFFVKTSFEAKECFIEFGLGSNLNPAKGFAFFDDLKFATTDEQTYLDANANNFTSKTDLNKVNLNNISENSDNYIFTAQNFTGTLNSTDGIVEAGVINSSTHPSLDVGNVTSPYLLTIHNITDSYYTLKSNDYKLTSGNNYKITISVKTLNANQESFNAELDDNEEVIPFGAKIALSNLDASVEGIVTGNNFEEYTFYIHATTDTTINFNLSMGYEKALTRGYAFFDNLSVALISEDDFNLAKNNKQEDDEKTIIIGSTESKEEEPEDTTTENVSFDWLVLPTLIIALALLIAMVGLLIRRLNIKLPVRTTVRDYDRAKTLVKDMERREKLRIREERLKALREKLQQIQEEINKNKEEYQNTKTLKEEIKAENIKVEEKIKQTFKDTTSKEAILETRKLKLEAKQKIKQLRKEKYLERRNELYLKYLEIEKEIEAILEEERLLVQEYKAYRKQLKLQKQEEKLSKKNKK